MAKLKSPLLSFSAHGTLGDVLVFFDRHGKSYARSKPKDPVSLSLAQGVLRDCFASAAVSALSLTQGQKDSYAALAPNSAFCPWWNNFIGEYIKDNYEAPSVVSTFIKSAQIAVGTILNGQGSVDVVVNSVVPDNCAPFMLGVAPVNDDPRNFGCYVSFLDSTHVRFVRHWSPMTGDLIVSAMVLEFEPDFIVSAQSKTLAPEAGDTTKTISIDAVDLSKTVLFPKGFTAHADVTPQIYNWYTDFQDNTTVRIRRSTSGAAGYVIVLVVEFI